MVTDHSRLLQGNSIDETVRQWLICTITPCNITVSAFPSSQTDVQLLIIDHPSHCTGQNGSINSFHPIEFQPITIDTWHMFPRDICLPSGSWLTGWQFVCLWKRRKSVNSACEFVHIPDGEKMPVIAPCSSKCGCYNQLFALPTCSQWLLLCPF